MLERVAESVRLANGAVITVYRKPRARKAPWRCRVTFVDGSTVEGGDALLMTRALEWGLATARGEGVQDAQGK